MTNRRIFIKIALLLVIFISGCHRFNPKNSEFPVIVPENLRPRSVIELQLDREKLDVLIKRPPPLNSVRLVEVFQGKVKTPPRYRLFDVKKGSVYEFMGLSNSDIIVALDNYYFYSPSKFGEYIGLLPKLNEGSVTVEKGGQTLLLRYLINPKK